MIESLYFSCYYAYLRGNLEQAQLYYTLLKEEFKEKKSVDPLEPHQLLELKKIRDAITSGNISKNIWLEEPVGPIAPNRPAATMRQNELVQQIATQGLERLKVLLQDDVYLYNIEHPCGDYGSVDMVYMGKETVYPIEVKKDRGEHDLIGQLSKYDLHHKLRLHYKFYKRVRSVALCGSYDPYALQELRQLDFKTLLYSIKDNGLRLEPS